MSDAAMHEKWNEKCQLAQERYHQDPSPTNLSEMQKALYERGLFEEEMDPSASHTHRP
jgi:hypothetical protein